MKYILFLLLSLSLISCEKTYEVRRNLNGVVTSRYHKDSETVWEYHYGYSHWRGKFCYHYGSNHHPEKFETTVVTKSDTSTSNSSEIYNNYKENDSIPMVEVKRYREKDKKLLSTYYYFSN